MNSLFANQDTTLFYNSVEDRCNKTDKISKKGLNSGFFQNFYDTRVIQYCGLHICIDCISQMIIFARFHVQFYDLLKSPSLLALHFIV